MRGPVHEPGIHIFRPAFLASHSFEYVNPLHPQTGSYIVGHTV
ncbi:MAG: hypothetical protein VX517_04805 [Candidatus Neomarinimicrobiota bacterium]|nr:hypothetical protein [Candidatus Neomarinimicrobiota bacterium]